MDKAKMLCNSDRSYNIVVAVIASVIALLLSGCAHTDEIERPFEPLPPAGKLYPALLPEDKAHPVDFVAKNVPASLTMADVEEIKGLVARIPGIDRQIRVLTTPDRPPSLDPSVDISRVAVVYTSGFVLVMEKIDAKWLFRRYWMYAE